MWTFETELAAAIPRTATIRTFRWPIRAKGVRYRPGQFMYIDILVNGRPASHHFTISSSPTERGYLEFTKRITSSAFSQTLAKMEPGAWGRLTGPNGNFTPPSRPRKLAYLCGGIGITPVRGMMRYMVDKALPFDVVLLYGNNSREDIPFREELEFFETHAAGSIRIEHVLSGPDVPPEWRGRRGFIDSALVKAAIPDYEERLFYVSGPPGMVNALHGELDKLGMPASRVRFDKFTGYE